MNFLDAFLASIGIALVFFEPTMEIGTLAKSLSKKKATLLGLVFGLCQLIVAAIGMAMAYLINLIIPPTIKGTVQPYIAFSLLLFSGIYMILFALEKKIVPERRSDEISVKQSMRLALRYSARVLAVNMGIFFICYNWFYEIALIFGISVLVAILGLYFGYFKGFRHNKGLCIVDGVFLCLLAFKLIVHSI